MKNLILLCIILPICLVESSDPKVLNLALKDHPNFHVTEIPNQFYQHLQFDTRSEFRITAVIDSGADIWISEDGNKTYLLRANVYYKNKIAQVVKLNIYFEKIDENRYYARENGGTFKQTPEQHFNAMIQTDDCYCVDLFLDFRRGFGFHLFRKEKIIVYGQNFIKFVPNKKLDVVKLTNGTDLICERAKLQFFVYAIYFHRPGINEMIKIVVEDPDKNYKFHYFQFSNKEWIRSNASILQQLYKTPQPSAEATGSGSLETAIVKKTDGEFDVHETTPEAESSGPISLPYFGDKVGDTASLALLTKVEISTGLVLTLETAHEDKNFNVTDTTSDNGLVYRIVLPEDQNLKEIICKNFNCGIDPYTQLSYNMVSSYFYEDAYHLIAIDLTAIDNSLETEYIRVCDGKLVTKSRYLADADRLIKADHASLADPEFLCKDQEDPSSIPEDSPERLIEFDLESDYVKFLYIWKTHDEGINPQRKYRTKDGFFIAKIRHKKKVIWRAYLKNERATRGTLYYINDQPGYLSLTIPDLDPPDNRITIDLVSGKKTPNFKADMLTRVLTKYSSEFSITFNLTDPIDYTAFNIDKTTHRNFICRSFTSQLPIISVYHHKDHVTPSNIVPFRDMQVYYYQRSPVLFVTDPVYYPRVFMKAIYGWRSSSLSTLDDDLDGIKNYLDGPHLESSRSLYLSYEDYQPTSFEVEVRTINQIISKTFLPTFKSFITLITCNNAEVHGSPSFLSSGVKFYLKNNKPYKAEVHKHIRGGIHKLIFKVYDETGGRPKWNVIDEDDFNKL